MMKTLLYSPYWFFQLFTTAKSFKGNPIIGSPTLNKLGLHISRVVLAHISMRFRMWLLSFGVDPDDQMSYQQNGFVAKENFVSAELFQQIETEIRNFHGEIRECQQGDTQNHRILLDPATLAKLPYTQQLLNDKAFKRLLRYTAGHRRMPFFHIEQVRNGVANAGSDPQKSLHADTFHPTMKFWLFLDDVDEHNGPFTYIPSSNQLTRQRLHWEYQTSQIAYRHPDSYSARGSFRVSPADREALGLPEPKAFKVRKNTLVIGNTFGIHGRGQADAGSTRLAIWGMSRTNPFIPFPGLGLTLFDRWQYTLLNTIRTWQDRKAAKQGRQAAWHRIE
ncbi:phytanoyl-CoA dioxygenase family protein [uncultured Thiothrix sp.]|uniref:phytanoyl-CoA dioxygenase family protein n=1 Tax=uncultured Thiothrix sp. TaxID=223185 RepID=UPI00260483EC|nr:phytanoyl-CoA dioxygenase family protein [uncultured Thiothrix sp.]